VLDTLVESGARLCRADRATIVRLSGDKLELVASHGMSPEFKESLLNGTQSLRDGIALRRERPWSDERCTFLTFRPTPSIHGG
jgi:hypothetical protein